MCCDADMQSRYHVYCVIDLFGLLKLTINKYHSSDTSYSICLRFRNCENVSAAHTQIPIIRLNGLVNENVRAKNRGTVPR